MNDVLILSPAIVGLAAFVAGPLYRRRPAPPPAGGDPERARRTAVSRARSDLEIDVATGLIDPADHERERHLLDPTD